MLTREAILAHVAPLPMRRVECPALGGSVHIKTMTAQERDEYELVQSDLKQKGIRSVRATMLACTVCDEQGKRLFTSADVLALGQLGVTVIDDLVEVAFELNGFSAKDEAELAGNSEGPEADDASSSS